MKIAIFSDCYLDLTGGIVTNINTEKRELERRGHTVYVFSSAYPRSREAQQELAKQHIYPVPSCRVLGRGLTPVARRPKIIERWLLKHHPELRDFDVFYVHYEAGCSIAGLRLGRQLHIPTIQVMHGREDRGEELIIPRGFRTIVATLLCWFHSWYLPHPVRVRRDDYLAPTLARAKMWELMVNHANAADFVLTPSDFFRRMLIHYGLTQSSDFLPHAIANQYIDTRQEPRWRQARHPLEIIWHSRLSPEKRILPFLEALTYVEGPYHLSVYGDGFQAKEAQAYATRHRLKVTFHGPANFDQIWEALRQAHLDVLVSYDYDTFGTTLIEAEAAGVPVLICDPSLQEVVPQEGLILASSPDPRAIAKCIDFAICRQHHLSNMSQAMLDERTNLRIGHKIDRLERLFDVIIKSYE